MAWGFDAQVGADQWLSQRIQQQELARRAEQERIQNILNRVGQQEQTRQFDAGLGEQQRQFNAEAPTREAGRLYTGAQTAELGRRPQAELDERAHERGMVGLREGSEGRLITKRADEDIRVSGSPPQSERVVQVMGPNGTPIYVRESEAPGMPAAQAPRAVTGSERQTLSFFQRAKQASDDITPIEEQIANQSLLGQVRGQIAPNMMQTETQQLYRQAQRAFTEARLRKESGAAIPTPEYENDARTYFAQPGDSQAVMEQKRRARQVVLDGLKNSAGKAVDEFYGGSEGNGAGADSDPLGLFK